MRWIKRHPALLAVMTLFCLFLGGLAWLLGTSEGALWALSAVSRWTSLQVEVRQVEGRLAGDLKLRGIRVAWPEGTAAIDSLDLSWHPLALFEGRISVEELALRGMTVRQQPGEHKTSPLSTRLEWPSLKGPPVWIRGEVRSLLLENLQVYSGSGEPFKIEHFRATVLWKGGTLSVHDLQVATPEATVQGKVRAGFVRPSLAANLDAVYNPEGEISRQLTLALVFSPGPPGALFSGPLTVSLEPVSQRVSRLLLDAQVAVRENAILVKRFDLTSPGRRGSVSGGGELVLGEEEPSVKLQAKVQDLDLAPEAGFSTALSGSLEITGNRNRYGGSFVLSNRGAGWKAMKLAGPFSGDLGTISLPGLNGECLGGSLKGSFDLSWEGEVSFRGTLQGQGLDPAKISPDWPGRVNFTLTGNYRQKEGLPPQATLEAKLLDSTLRGRKLRGQLEARLKEGDVHILHAALHGDGFDAVARGSLAEKLTFETEVQKLSGLLPGAKGRFQASGWVRRRSHLLSGSLNARGQGLAYSDFRAKGLNIAASLSGVGPSISLEVGAQGLRRGSLALDAATLGVKGTLEKHRITFAIHWPEGDVQGRAEGGYGAEIWKGRVLGLRGRERDLGQWRLQKPFDLMAGAGKVRFSPAVIASAAGERLRLAADFSREPLLGSVYAEWEKLDLGYANAWLGEMAISGRSSGSADLRWLKGGNLALKAALDASGKVAFHGQEVTVEGASAKIRWDNGGLQSSWDVRLNQKTSLTGSLSSDLPAQSRFPRKGEARFRFQDINLALLEPWLPSTGLSGSGSGNGHFRWGPGERLELKAEAQLSGKFSHEGLELDVQSASASLEGGEKGLSASMDIALAQGGKLKGEFSSSGPLRLGWPERGSFALDCQDLDPAKFQSFMPKDLHVGGRLSGQVRGQLLSGGRLDLEGKTSLADGRLQWRGETGQIGADVKSAEITLAWREKTMSGELNLALADYGRIHGDFSLPLPARLPVALDENGPLRGRLAGEMKEKGLLAILFPGLVRESQGRFNVDLGIGGSWSHPDYSGTLQLADGGAFLLAAGIQLEKVEARAHFAGDKIDIESFQAVSGSGRIQGSATGRLKDWTLESYQVTIKGERFQAIHLPELEVEISPDLSVEGTPETLQVRGKVLIPHLLATGFKTQTPVQSSPDVVIVSASQAQKKPSPIKLDIQVRLVLGDHVWIKAMGLDARLEGDVTVKATSQEKITGEGEIKVAEGTYSAYGVKLKITRGSVLFAGGSVTRPTLNVEASRTVQDVTAGVRVTGTPQAPKVTLYSTPTMPDTDILSYIVLGHPLSSNGGQASLLTAAAGGLLAQGESAGVQEEIKSRLGLSELSVESGGGNLQQSMVTIGKYLNPDLYIGIGQSLFTNSQELRMRYNLTKRWELESKMGVQSGVDLYYKIEFE
jgi:translocation and assembly module TamB